MREIKFRAWDANRKIMYTVHDMEISIGGAVHTSDGSNEWECVHGYNEVMQYTGLKDKNGVEIYELCEIDSNYTVVFINSKYVLKSISSGDIVCHLYDYMESRSSVEVTREYSEI